MQRIAVLARSKAKGLGESRLAKFLRNKKPDLGSYLALDDMVVWSELGSFADAKDPALPELCRRLLERNLFKCFDVGPRLDRAGGHEQLVRFRERVSARFPQKKGRPPPVLEDDATVTGYKWYDVQDPHALKKVLVQRKKDDAIPVDIAAEGVSAIVQTLLRGQERVHRFYVASQDEVTKLEKVWERIGR